MAIRWRCTLCGECCKQYIPLVLPEDVLRIQYTLKLPLSAFVAFYSLEDFDGAVEESDERFFRTRHGKFALGLARRMQPDGREGCVFLRNNICSIHPFKPLICRQYPFEPQDPENPEGPFTLMENPCFGNHAQDEIVDEAPIRRSYQEFVVKHEAYVKKIQEWNQDPRSWESDIEDFLSFVGLGGDSSAQQNGKEVIAVAKPGSPKPKPGAKPKPK